MTNTVFPGEWQWLLSRHLSQLWRSSAPLGLAINTLIMTFQPPTTTPAPGCRDILRARRHVPAASPRRPGAAPRSGVGPAPPSLTEGWERMSVGPAGDTSGLHSLCCLDSGHCVTPVGLSPPPPPPP